MPEGALAGLRILDLTQKIAGPYCTKLLSEFGAEVIKVEKPGSGDEARRTAPFLKDDPNPEKSGLFLYLNTNKKSITLDLETDSGRSIFRELVKRADIVVESFEPKVLPALGLDYENLEKINPALVMTSITAFGQTGPYKDYKSEDIIAYSLGGLMYLIGFPDREPLKTGGSQAQYQAGLNAAIGTLGASYNRELTGLGQHVDVSVMESVLTIIENTTVMYTYQGVVRRRVGSRLPRGNPLTDIYPCREGYIAIAVQTNQQWESFTQMIGHPELLEDPRFNDPVKRTENGKDLEAYFRPWFLERTEEEAFHTGQLWRIPFGRVMTFDQMIDDPQFKARDFFIEIDHPVAGKIRYPGGPFVMSETPALHERAPLLGEHNEEVLCGSLGYGKDDLVKLRSRGII